MLQENPKQALFSCASTNNTEPYQPNQVSNLTTLRHFHACFFIATYLMREIRRFGCNPGYMMLGPKSMRCVKGVWTKGVPYCARDVARAKPAYLKPADPEHPEDPAQIAELALDGNDDTCSVTRSAWGPRMWGVALLDEATVTTLKIVFGTSFKDAHLEVRTKTRGCYCGNTSSVYILFTLVCINRYPR